MEPTTPTPPVIQVPQDRFLKLKTFFANLRSKSKAISGILGILIVTASLGAGVYLVQRQQRAEVGASGVQLSLVPTNSAPKIGDTFSVGVGIKTNGMSVTGADLKINYNASVLQAQSIQAGTFLPTVLVPGSVGGGIATITVGVLINSAGAYPKSGIGALATIVFKATAAGQAAVSFSSETAVAAVGQNSNVVGVMTPVNITVSGPTGSPSPAPSASPTATPHGSPSPTPAPSASPTASPTGTPGSSPTPAPPACPDTKLTAAELLSNSDVNQDNKINVVDIGIVDDPANYQKSPPKNPRADVDGNGCVNIVDIGIILDNYGK